MNKGLIELFLGYCKEDGNGIGVSIQGRDVKLPMKYIKEFEYEIIDDSLYICYLDDGCEQKIVINGLRNFKVEEWDEYIQIKNEDMEIVIEELV